MNTWLIVIVFGTMLLVLLTMVLAIYELTTEADRDAQHHRELETSTFEHFLLENSQENPALCLDFVETMV